MNFRANCGQPHGHCLVYAVGSKWPDRAAAALPAGAAGSPSRSGPALPVDPSGRARDYLRAVPRAVLAGPAAGAAAGFMIPPGWRTRDAGVPAGAQPGQLLLRVSAPGHRYGGVRMTARPPPRSWTYLVVVGRLHVQEHWSGACLGSLYQLDGESVTTESPALPLALRPGLE